MGFGVSSMSIEDKNGLIFSRSPREEGASFYLVEFVASDLVDKYEECGMLLAAALKAS